MHKWNEMTWDLDKDEFCLQGFAANNLIIWTLLSPFCPPLKPWWDLRCYLISLFPCRILQSFAFVEIMVWCDGTSREHSRVFFCSLTILSLYFMCLFLVWVPVEGGCHAIQPATVSLLKHAKRQRCWTTSLSVLTVLAWRRGKLPRWATVCKRRFLIFVSLSPDK